VNLALNLAASNWAYWLRLARPEPHGYCKGFFRGSAEAYLTFLRLLLPKVPKYKRREIGERIALSLKKGGAT